MGLQLITPPAELPVTVEEARVACRIAADEASFDDLLGLLLGGACEEIGTYIAKPLGLGTWLLTLDRFSDAIELPVGPVSAVASIGYDDPDGVARTLAPEVTTLDLVSSPQWVVLNAGESWPALLDAVNSVRVTFVAGFSAETLPANLRQAALGLVQHRFDNGMAAAMPAGVKALADQHRRIII